MSIGGHKSVDNLSVGTKSGHRHPTYNTPDSSWLSERVDRARLVVWHRLRAGVRGGRQAAAGYGVPWLSSEASYGAACLLFGVGHPCAGQGSSFGPSMPLDKSKMRVLHLSSAKTLSTCVRNSKPAAAVSFIDCCRPLSCLSPAQHRSHHLPGSYPTHSSYDSIQVLGRRHEQTTGTAAAPNVYPVAILGFSSLWLVIVLLTSTC
jgi:hypothetical protein